MLLRPQPEGLGVYLTRRSPQSRFMPDAFVFPGGRVEPADAAIASGPRVRGRAGDVASDLAVAAVRELFEEAGILLARGPRDTALAYDGATLDALRAELHRGVSFATLLDDLDLTLDLSALAHYSNWITPTSEPIRFDAHFFMAQVPADQVAAADAIEVHDGIWLTPRDALDRADRNEMSIRFPTRKHLERLARFADLDAALAHARTRRVAPVLPEERDDGTFDFDEEGW
jgi:8-oxo-dGTP pyrophosphatase MutT (NUDIX family)